MALVTTNHPQSTPSDAVNSALAAGVAPSFGAQPDPNPTSAASDNRDDNDKKRAPGDDSLLPFYTSLYTFSGPPVTWSTADAALSKRVSQTLQNQSALPGAQGHQWSGS